VFSYITSAAVARGNRVCVLVHRQELVDQVSCSLAAMGVPHGIIAGGYPETPEPVQVASVASLVRRLGRTEPFDLLIPDEAHHAVAGSWKTILVDSHRHELASTQPDLRLRMRHASDLRCLPTPQPMVTCSDSEVGQP